MKKRTREELDVLTNRIIVAGFAIMFSGLIYITRPSTIKTYDLLVQELNKPISLNYGTIDTYLQEQAEIDLAHSDSIKYEIAKLDTNKVYIEERAIDDKKTKRALYVMIPTAILTMCAVFYGTAKSDSHFHIKKKKESK